MSIQTTLNMFIKSPNVIDVNLNNIELKFTKYGNVYIIDDKIIKEGAKTFDLYLLEENEEVKTSPSYKQKLYSLEYNTYIFRYVLNPYEEEVPLCYDYVPIIQTHPPIPPPIPDLLIKTPLYQPTRKETRAEIARRTLIEQEREEYERRISIEGQIPLQRQVNEYLEPSGCIDCSSQLFSSVVSRCKECYDIDRENTLANMSVDEKIQHLNLLNRSRHYATNRWTNFDSHKRNSLPRNNWMRQLIDKKDREAGKYVYNIPGCYMSYRGGARVFGLDE